MSDTDAPTSGSEREHRLVGFSATAGVGYFLNQHLTHRFDLIADEIFAIMIEPGMGRQLEFGVVPCFLTFQTRTDLLAYAREEYLRAKKAEYFTAVFTRELPRELFVDLLTFLDDPDLLDVPVAVEFRRRLESVASPRRVASVVGESKRSQFRNLRLALEVEFGELVHSEAVQFLQSHRLELQWCQSLRPGRPGH